MLVDAAGQAKIIDFGIARTTDGDVALTTMHTELGQLVGTVQYMCPEQFAGDPDAVDVRADVYALGVVLYELLVGRLPYDVTRRPVYAVARVVQEAEPTPISTVNPRFRGDLATIVMKCLEKDRARRYSSAAELEADLGRYLGGEPITASPPRLGASLVRLARRHKLAALTATGLLTAIVAGGIGASIFAVQAARERATALRETARADAEATLSRQRLYVANLRSLQAAISTRNLRLGRQLHAENLALVGAPTPLELNVLAADLDHALVVLDWKRGPVRDVTYSPDGRILAASGLIREWLTSADHLTDLRRVSHADSRRRSRLGELLFFAVGPHQEHARRDASADNWTRSWRTHKAAADGLHDVADPASLPLAACPTGRRSAIHTAEGRVRVVTAASAADDVILEHHRGRLTAAAFSPDGTRLAILGAARSLGLWDVTSGRRIAMLGDADARFGDFHFSSDGGRIAAIFDRRDRRREICLYDTRTGRHLSTVSTQRSLGPIDSLLAFSPDGDRLTTNFEDHELQVWDVASGTRVARLPGTAGIATAAAFSTDGKHIAGGFTNGTIRLWDSRTSAVERELLGHDGGVTTLAFHPDGETLASGAHDGTVRIWSLTAEQPLATLPEHRGMTAAAFSPDGRQLAVAPQGTGSVELWNPRTVQRLHALASGPGLVTEVAYSPDSALVAAAFKNGDAAGEVRVWRADTGEPLATLAAIGRGVERVAFSPDGSCLLTTSGDATVAVWEPRTGRQLMAVASGYHGAFVAAGAVFGLAGTRVAYRMPHLLDAKTGAVATTLRPQGHVTCLAASPNGLVRAAGMAIGSIDLADFATGKRIAMLIGHRAAVRALAFSADGRRLAAGSTDGSVRLWDVRSSPNAATAIRVFSGHEGVVETVLFSPDGRRIVTASRDGTARIWDAESGHELCILPAPRAFPRAVVLSPDGALLVTAAATGGVRIHGLSNAAVVSARQAAAAAR
jgi:WD40 repeat protein